MRVLVTGGAGCIGSWCVKWLLKKGIDVMVYDQHPNPVNLSHIARPVDVAKVKYVEGRIEDTARVKTLVKDEGITHILHLAAVLIPYSQVNPVQAGLVDVIGTLNIFEAARDAGRPVRIIYASSSSVKDPDDASGHRLLDEDDSAQPGTHYGVFKMANEGNARVFHAVNGIDSVGLRPWIVYGVGRDTGLTAGPTLAIKSAVKGEPYRIGITGYLDFQYVADVAEIFNRCLLADMQGAHVFNLAGDIVRIDDFIAKLAKLRPGAEKLITYAGSKVPVSYQMDCAALAKLFPDLKRTSLEDGMGETIEIYERLQAAGQLR